MATGHAKSTLRQCIDLDAGENTVAQAALAFEAKGVAAHAKRTLKAHLGNTHASRVLDCRSRFPLGLRAWLQSRQREQLQTSGNYSPCTLIAASVQRLEADSPDAFAVQFVADCFFQLANKVALRYTGAEMAPGKRRTCPGMGQRAS